MTSTQPRRNRLASETSPYLLQHAENPVDWYPWGPEAFELAKRLDKPILLSVGYSSCHWCHVMAHESFENPAIADAMNEYFVNIKVDREERPDVDGVYMSAVQAMTGQGGWPMTVFMTPEGKPFYAGTYFPPEDGHGRPGFHRVLLALRDAWAGEREQVLESAGRIAEHLEQSARRATGPGLHIDPALPARAVERFQDSFDPNWGGFGGAPKFPSPSNLEFLLAHHARNPDGATDGYPAGAMAIHTLDRMALGGMYDHLGGGFARYSVDQYWLVPHFEKMLYDNAQLARAYLHAWQVTGDAFYERIARETLDYLLREMRDPEGGFYAAQDADSEGIEGKFFVWTVQEVYDALGDDAPFFCDAYGVSLEGNFQDPHHPDLTGRNVLSRLVDVEAVAQRHGLTQEQAEERAIGLRSKLFEAREKRVKPGLDDKVLTSWNGLALAAFAEAARALGEPRYRDAALANARFVRERMWSEGRLFHTYKAPAARVDGMLEDYAFYGLGLVELYKLTGDLAWLEWAKELFGVVLHDFYDAEAGGFFETRSGGEQLIVRQKPLFDGPTPSGNAAAGLLALWLSRYYGVEEWERFADDAVALVSEFMVDAPTGFGGTWQIVEFLLAPHRELVIAGAPGEREPFEREAGRRFLPFVVIAPTAGGGGLPHFEGREDATRPRAFLCENMVCGLPATTPAELVAQLDAAAGRAPG